ncbi:MAG: hypothetical protein RMI94_10380 [Bryobacterales bacterium]|nr:hypothetical protein [Bryobacteraceae bacterium]MDW8130945.1 hypothetical protein [Bryobacterales bacterium]
MPLRVMLWGLACALAVPAKASLLELAMPDARFLAGANLESVRGSKLAQALWAQLQAREREVGELARRTGFDPLRDLSEVLIASPGGSKPSVLLVARGAFDRTDLAAVVRSKMTGREIYQGVEILLAEEKRGEPMALAFLDATLLVAGDPASVRGAIARRGRGALAGGELRREAQQWMARYDAWGVSVVPFEELASRARDEQAASMLAGDVVKAVEQVAGGVRLRDALELDLRTVSRSEQDAVNLANALRFFSGMLQAREPAAASYLRELSVEGRTMRLAMAVPEDELLRIAGMLGLRARTTTTKPAAPPDTGVTIYSSPGDMGIVRIPAPGKPQ